MTINTFIKDLGLIFSIPDLALEKNACAIQFENNVHIDFYYEEEDRSLRMATSLGILISSTKYFLCKKILIENSKNKSLEGNYFCLNIDGTEIVLCSTIIECEQTPKNVSDYVVKLCEQQKLWHENLVRDGFLVV
jgi:hypothetical protein